MDPIPIASAKFLESLSLWVHPKSRLLICFDEKCRHAISPVGSNPTNHLRDEHSIPLPRRKGLSKVLAKLKLKSSSGAAPLLDGSPEEQRLRSYDGFSCLHCSYRTINLTLIMQHYSQDLPEYPQHPRRSTRRADIEAYFEYVYLQAWASGSSRVYWIVARNGQLTRPTVPVGHMSGSALSRRDRIGQEQQDLIRSVQEREHQRNHGLAADMQTSAAGSTTMYAEQRPWLERTRWEITYRNRDRSLHRSLIQTPYLSFYGRPDAPPYLLASAARVTGLSTDLVSPREDEIKIDGILKVVDVVMDRCEETVHRTSRNLLCWLKSNHPHMPYPKPFTLVKHASSTTRYRLLLKKALAFCFRVYRMDAKQRERLVGVHFSKKLNRFLDEIWHHEDLASLPLVTEDVAQAEERVEEASGDEMRVEDEDLDMDMDMDGNVYGDLNREDDDDDDSDLHSTIDEDSDDDVCIPSDDDENGVGNFAKRPERVESLVSLAELVFGLSLALCTERLTDGQPSSTVLVYFSGILAFSEATNSFHNARSYTPYLSGLIYIQRLLFLERALPLRPYALLGIERRPRFKQLERFKQVHRRYMVMGSQSTFEEFVSLRAYGCVAARNDTPSLFLHWSDDGQRVSWEQGAEVSMGQFRSLATYLIREANRLCNDLMFGLEPDIDLLKIKDNMANCDKGYSFVTDPKNELASAYLDLFRRACTARSGCLSRGSSWNWPEVNQYLKKEEDFRELLGAGMSLTGGQLPRWPELSSLWVENDELGPRGLYVYKGYIVYVVRHHKVKSSTNREFVVVRFLPAELALAVFKYCTYIRPFINLLDRERGIVSPSEAGQSSSPLLFRTQTISSNSKVWSTSRFTSVIRKVTTKAWGFAVNSRLLRQICIGITEKHVREVYQPFNRFDDRSKDAHRNVVFAWQSGHRPLQRGSTYGLDGAFPTTMQPQLLDLYEWASLRWHEFLHLPSKLRPRVNAQVHSDRERILGHQPRLTSRGAEEMPTAGIPVSEMQVTPGQKRSRDRVVGTPVVVSSSSTSLDRTPAPEAIENTLGRSLAEAYVPPKDTAPPPKRRRTLPLSFKNQDVLDQSLNDDDWSHRPLFGYPSDIATSSAMLTRMVVLDHLGTRVGFSDDKNPLRANLKLWTLGEQLEEWCTVGCQLCYVCGDMGLDHKLDDCTSEGSDVARRLLGWLETLRLDRFVGARGNCSLCTETNQICEDIAIGLRVSDASTEEEKNRWKQKYMSATDPDGLCGNKPAIRRAIAALCAFDEQLLGKTLTTFISRKNNVDLTKESQAVGWFERKVPHGETWVPQLLVVFDVLVTAFGLYLRRPYQADRRADQDHPISAGPSEEQLFGLPSLEMSWGDSNEVAEWRTVMDWWAGKCSFCAGRGVRGPQIEHTLRQCPFGGKQTLKTELAEAIYEEGMWARGGCQGCALPREVCKAWVQSASGEWERDIRIRCQYGRQAYDTAIGFFYCKNSKFRIELMESMADEGLNDFEGEAIAVWLGEKIRRHGGF